MAYDMSTSQLFAERLRTVRRRAGLRQGDLAKEIGITSRAIVRWESGDAERFTLDTLVLLADRFGVSLDYLLGREDDADASIGININQRWNQLFRLQLQRVETAIDAGADTDLVKKLNILERHELAKILPHEDYRSMMLSKGGSQ